MRKTTAMAGPTFTALATGITRRERAIIQGFLTGGHGSVAAGYSLVLLDSDSQVILAVWPNAFDIY